MKKTTKKLLAVFLAAMMLLPIMPLNAFAAAVENPLDYLEYEIIDGEVTITDCDESINGDLEMPLEIEGCPVTEIDDWAFESCIYLTSVTIPDTVTSIGECAFCFCMSLTNIDVDDNNKYYSSDEYGVLYNKEKSELLQYPVGNERTSFAIPDSVTSISVGAFRDCSSLTSVSIPDSVTRIGEFTFYCCESLTSITIPDSVTSIGSLAFSSCDSLTSVTIPDSVTSISSAFSGCDSLTNVTIGNGVTSIGDGAFAWCESLTSITIPYSVTSIGNGAFEYCTSLTNVTIGNGVTSIGGSAFSGCTSLTSITIPDSVTSIGDYAFRGCDSLTNVTIGNGVTSIGDGAFASCESLTSITIPDSVTSIGNDAFKYCTSLTSVTIPDSVTSIGGYAFSGCDSLTSVTIPDSVTSIGGYAFSGCDSLTSVTIPDSVTSIGDYVFAWCDSLTSVTIPDSVTSIGGYAFYDCTNLASVTIGNSVTSIGRCAFEDCTSLASVTIPDSVTSIGSYAFSGTAYYNNESNWENGVLYISNHIIVANDDISGAYTIKSGTKTIADYAFYNCTSLTSVTIPDSVTSIGEGAFDDCTSLTNVTIPDSVTSIGRFAFYGCRSLTSVTIPDSVTSIGGSAFYDCDSLTSVTIPKSVTNIGETAFGYYYYDKTYKKSNFKIYCYSGTAGAKYAIDNGFDYELLDDEPTTYTVTYNANGGAGAPSAQTKTEGTALTLSATAPTREGYKFLGWSADKNATSAQFAAGASYTTDSDITLYAVWSANSYTVNFCDGSTVLGTKSLRYGESGTLSLGYTPTKFGYKFIGWSTVNGGPALFNDGQSIKNLSSVDGATVTYYAAWEKSEEKTDVVMTDKESGVAVTVPNGTYDGDVTLKIDKVLSGSAFDIIEKQTDGIKSTVFSIETYVGGVKTQPDGYVTVKIPVPSGYNAQLCKIYYINTDKGIAEEIPSTVEGNYLVFTTNHFSDWAIVQTGKVNSVTVNDISKLQYKDDENLDVEISADEGVNYTVSYSSSNPEVVSVDENGKVYGAGEGSADITVTVTDENGYTVSDTCKVTVKYAWWQVIIRIILLGFLWY